MHQSSALQLGLARICGGAHGISWWWAIFLCSFVGCAQSAATSQTPAQPAADSPTDADLTTTVAADDDQQSAGALYETVSLRGQVVWTADALQRRYHVNTVSEAKERSLALDAADGRLYPLIEDSGGRAFRRDERLRERDVELLARFYPAAGMLQVIRIYFVKSDGKYLVDYWCDVCSISMVADGPCDCCQQPNRLREQLVE